MKPEAAIYLQQETKANEEVNAEQVEKIHTKLARALGYRITKIRFNLKTMSKNITIQGATEFVQRYATGALTKIINGQPITNKTMLDSLFNTYAPALNAGLLQSGYNSISAMKEAAMNGTINVSNFLSAFSSGLSAVSGASDQVSKYEKYGEEIPIDIVEQCDYMYSVEAPDRRTGEGKRLDYLIPLEIVELKMVGHVKNKNAELWEMNDFSYKLADTMSAKKDFILRVGKTIYENIYLVKYEPIITNAHEIKFNATFYYKYRANNFSLADEQTGCRIIKNELQQELANWTSKEKFLGTYPVTKVTKFDTDIIAQAKKALRKDKLLIDGEYV